MFKSTDGGASWSARGNVPANAFLVTDTVTPGILYAGGDSGLFKSTDDGRNWIAAGPAFHRLVIDPLNATTLYAARTDYDCFWLCGEYQCFVTSLIFKSNDGATSWTQVATFDDGLAVYTLAIDPLMPTTLYAAGIGIVKSTDGGATWDVPETPTPADTVPPDTVIASARDDNGTTLANNAVTLSRSLTLSFTGTDNVALSRFECRLDGAGFSACTSPLAYSALALGHHTFEVRAVDTSSNVDATPAFYSWTVDAAPDTTITSAIDSRGKPVVKGGTTTSNTMTFAFTGVDNGTITRFECRLDSNYFTICTSPTTYAGIGRGMHTFQVRAIDNNGLADPSPAAFSWTR